METVTTKTAKATKGKAAAEVAPKVVVPRERFMVIRRHPTYKGLVQAFTGDTWVLAEPVGDWTHHLPSVNSTVAKLAKALLGSDSGVYVGPHGAPVALTLFGGVVDRLARPVPSEGPTHPVDSDNNQRGHVINPDGSEEHHEMLS